MWGGFTQLGPKGEGFFREDLRNVLYIPPQRLDGVVVQSPYLTALVLTNDELEAVQQFGMMRAMTTFGAQHRFFPTAPWVDRKRTEIMSPETMASSVLAKIPRVVVHGASVRRDSRDRTITELSDRGEPLDRDVMLASSTVALRVGPDGAKRLRDLFADPSREKALALLLDPDEDADGYMVWYPKQQGPTAIAGPGASGARLSGNFLVFAPGVEVDQVMGVEDGFSVLLTLETWSRIRSALRDGQPISGIGTSGGEMQFEITWLPQ